MQKIDRAKFFDEYRKAFGSLTQKQVDGIESLLASLEADEKITDLRHAAYMLATVKHETANTYQPIKEYGEGTGRKYGLKDPVTGQRFFGRGFVQLTWKYNYAGMGAVLRIDLVNHPDLALDSQVAYRIMSLGMRKGMFTGKKLSDYIGGDTCDYRRARRIINGDDCAERIAGYAAKIEAALRAGA